MGVRTASALMTLAIVLVYLLVLTRGHIELPI